MFLYTTKDVSPTGTVNRKDLKKIARDTLIFFAAPITVYVLQVSNTLTQNGIVYASDLMPTVMTVGAIQGWLIGIVINFLLKLQNPNA
jgi:hypothetical protein